jgi:hypothetical protein
MGKTRTNVAKGTQKPGHGSVATGWAGTNTNDHGHRGAEFGFSGLTHGDIGDKHGLHGRTDILTGGGFAGLSSEGQYGVGLGGKAAHGEIGYGTPGDGLYGSADVDAFGADAQAWVDPDKGAAVGAGAYFVQGSATAGNIGSGNHDEEMRFGLGAGVGAAGRLHWADSDGDGHREYGFGADIGPVSFDYKTEDPARSGLNLMTLGMGGFAADMMGYEGNMTEDIGSAASSAWDATSGAASSAWDATSGAASSAWDATSGAASSAWDATSGAASSVASSVGSAASTAWSYVTSW